MSNIFQGCFGKFNLRTRRVDVQNTSPEVGTNFSQELRQNPESSQNLSQDVHPDLNVSQNQNPDSDRHVFYEQQSDQTPESDLNTGRSESSLRSDIEDRRSLTSAGKRYMTSVKLEMFRQGTRNSFARFDLPTPTDYMSDDPDLMRSTQTIKSSFRGQRSLDSQDVISSQKKKSKKRKRKQMSRSIIGD